MRIDYTTWQATGQCKLRWRFALLAVFALTVTCTHGGFAQTVAYTGVTIETISDDTIENGTLVVNGDEIVAVGEDVDIPGNARVVSLKGMTIMPGLVDPYYVYKRSAAATRTVVFRGRTITLPGRANFTTGSFTWVGKYFYPYTTDFRPAMRTGITTANLVTDGRGLSALSNIEEEATDETVFEDEGVLFAQVTNQTTAIDIVRKKLVSDKKKTTTTSTRTRTRASSATDPTKEYWKAVNEGEKPMFVNVNNAAGVAHLLKEVKEHEKVRLVLVATGPNLFQSLDEIKKNENVTVVLQPGIDRVPFKSELMNVSRMLEEREIPFAISMSLSGTQMRQSQDDPMFPLAMLVRTGVDRQTALKSVTMKPAELLGIEKEYGSLEEGKKANFLVFDGDPLETGNSLKKVFLNGKLTYEN